MASCPACAAAADPTDRFCEACGARLGVDPRWRSSVAPADGCAACGGTTRGPEGYCDDCGRRRATLLDRAELAVAAAHGVTDRGARRARNEDAIALGTLDAALVGVVCDGVSTSARADDAAGAAVEAAVAALLRELDAGVAPERAMGTAFDAALAAVSALDGPTTRHASPSCTYVSGVVTAGWLAASWVGDSRAYWVPADGEPVCLTVDHALADADGAPHSAPLTRWVGADAGHGCAPSGCSSRRDPGASSSARTACRAT
ncbi:PP2C family protein-serine/threonine phosphatase [Luedemannella flava]